MSNGTVMEQMASPRLAVATFGLQCVILIALLLHLWVAWQHKVKWQDLSVRVSKLESMIAETAKPKSQR